MEVFIKDVINIYTDIKISTLDRLKNYNKNYKNKQNCRNLIDNSIKNFIFVDTSDEAMNHD